LLHRGNYIVDAFFLQFFLLSFSFVLQGFFGIFSTPPFFIGFPVGFADNIENIVIGESVDGSRVYGHKFSHTNGTKKRQQANWLTSRKKIKDGNRK
jgi:hypothetical protein